MSNQDSLAVGAIEKRFHEGLCLAAGRDYEQASTAFLECIVANPGCGEYVEEFLANLRGRPEQNVPDTAVGPAEALKRAAAEGRWTEVIERGLKTLIERPGSLHTLLALADASAAQGHDQAEACYVRSAVAAASDDVAIQRWGAAALSRLRKYDDAIACWRRAEALDPSDEEASEAIAELMIAKCRQRAGLEQAVSSRHEQANQPHQARLRWPIYSLKGLATTADGSGRSLTAIQQLEAAIRERPSFPETYLRLAELYLEKDRDYDAERLLFKGREATDNDPRITQFWEELSMIRHARRLQAAQQEVRTADNPQTREALAQVRKERDRGELEIFRARAKRQPENAANHVELARRLERSGKTPEAIEQFKKALDNAASRAPAALELAECYAQLGDIVQALRYYRLAGQSASAEHLEEKQESLTRASKLAARLKLNRLAERYQRTT